MRSSYTTQLMASLLTPNARGMSLCSWPQFWMPSCSIFLTFLAMASRSVSASNGLMSSTMSERSPLPLPALRAAFSASIFSWRALAAAMSSAVSSPKRSSSRSSSSAGAAGGAAASAAPAPSAAFSSGFIAGKRSTSLMLFLLLRNMVTRSMPMPQPPVGGRPYSRASQKDSSCSCASSSPLSLSFIWLTKRARWSCGSFNSVYALQISLPPTKSSKRSVRCGFERCFLASGLMMSGWSVMKVGLIKPSSKKSPTSLSRRRAVVRGGLQSTSSLAQSWSRYALASSLLRSSGILMSGTFSRRTSSRPEIIGTRLNGGVKSMVRGSSSPRRWYLMIYEPVISLTMPDTICSVVSTRSW
mmetsp:Transcript_11380/g.28781  ORF Transcript_11380/g.28781 Transcript_11380/m.28781 type:complete len:357 (-) Transcript_11380:1071-2141(-)